MSMIETVMRFSLCDVSGALHLCKASHRYLPQHTRAPYPMSTRQFAKPFLTENHQAATGVPTAQPDDLMFDDAQPAQDGQQVLG
jgi:hypothetical protein